MNILLIALWRQLATNRLASATSLVAIVIAVGAVVAVHTLSERLVAEIDRADPANAFGVTHWLRDADLTEQRYFDLRRRWRAGVQRGQTPLNTPGADNVTGMVPVIEANVTAGRRVYRLFAFDALTLADRTGASVERGSFEGVPKRGQTPFGTDVARLFVADTVLAHVSTGLVPGNTLTLEPGRLSVTVVGTFGDATQTASALLADIATGQRVLGTPGKLTAIGMSLETVPARWQVLLDALFPGSAIRYAADETSTIDGIPLTRAGDGDLTRFAGAILFNLGALSALSALVAAFLMYQNALSHVRSRELLMVRLDALGVPDGLVRGQLVLEGLVLSIVGSIVGIAVGHLGAALLLRLVVGGAAPDVAGVDVSISGWAVAKALFLAIAVGGGASALASTRRSAPAPHRRIVLVGVGLALCAVGAWLATSDVVGAFLAIGGLSVLAVVGLGAWVRFGIGALLRGRRASIFSILNLRQARAVIPNVDAALAALLLAVATAIGMGLMVQSLRDAFFVALDNRLGNDVVLQSDTVMDAAALSRLRALPGVERVTHYIDAELIDDVHARVQVSVTQLDSFEAGRYGFGGGDPAGGAVLVNEQGARKWQLVPGDELGLTGPLGRTSVVVAHVFRDYGAARPRVVMDEADAARLLPSGELRRVGVKLEQGPTAGRASVATGDAVASVESVATGDAVASVESVATGDVVASVERDATGDVVASVERDATGDAVASIESVTAFAAQSGWRSESRESVRAAAVETFERTFRVSDALVTVALIVAVIGMGSAFTSLELSRAAELRLLDVLGVGTARRVRMTVSQVGLLAVHVMLLAVPLGVAIGWVLCEWLNPVAFGWSIPLEVHAGALVTPLSLGLIAACVAGVLPTLRRYELHDV